LVVNRQFQAYVFTFIDSLVLFLRIIIRDLSITTTTEQQSDTDAFVD